MQTAPSSVSWTLSPTAPLQQGSLPICWPQLRSCAKHFDTQPVVRCLCSGTAKNSQTECAHNGHSRLAVQKSPPNGPTPYFNTFTPFHSANSATFVSLHGIFGIFMHPEIGCGGCVFSCAFLHSGRRIVVIKNIIICGTSAIVVIHKVYHFCKPVT